MPKFRKKPVVIDAEQWVGSKASDFVVAWEQMPMPPVPSHLLREKRAWWPWGRRRWQVRSLEGWYNLTPNDWVIRGVKGEYYPCKPDIFEATYDPVE